MAMQTLRSRDGTRIACETSGTGPALIIVNGGLSDRSAAVPLRPFLDLHFTLFAYDRRGRGDSGDTIPYAPEREIEDLAAVVEAVGAPAFVFAHSSGAMLALRAAIRGVPMRRLAVNEPPFIMPGTRPIPPRAVTSRIADRIAANDREEALRIFFLEQIGLSPPALDHLKVSPMWPRMIALAHTAPYDSEIGIDSALPVALLAKLTFPTLVLNGTASFAWIIETARALFQALPNAQAVHLEGQQHSPAPEVLAPALVRFFS
jgi:pimeloyl-ACP methyl ester carboxylesterase